MKKICTYLFALLCLPGLAMAQTDAPTREIGLRASSLTLENAGVIYKKQIRENTFRRYRLTLGNLVLIANPGATVFNFGVGGAIGREKRVPLGEKVQFIHGPEFQAAVSVLSAGGSRITIDQNGQTTTIEGAPTMLNPSVGFGYVLGVQYNVSPRFYVSAETIPSFSLNLITASGTTIVGTNLGFSGSLAALTVAYRF